MSFQAVALTDVLKGCCLLLWSLKEEEKDIFKKQLLQLQELKTGCCFMAGSSFVPLGHMLTHKIAYQIVTGLAYLHKKNIIFCDLKSDNILVWSLDVREHINIKLSDYGISRQSFHEGALGVEGTPGYQAPEIRPRIVYDEKVTWCILGHSPCVTAVGGCLRARS